MNSLTSSDEAPIRPLRGRPIFQTRVPGNRNRDCPAIREVDDQGVFSYVNLFGLDRSEVSL